MATTGIGERWQDLAADASADQPGEPRPSAKADHDCADPVLLCAVNDLVSNLPGTGGCNNAPRGNVDTPQLKQGLGHDFGNLPCGPNIPDEATPVVALAN